MKMWSVLHYLIWQGRDLAIDAAGTLDSPIFINDCISVLERARERPEDWFIYNFAGAASEYLLDFVEQRPDIYTRLLALSDEEEMAKLGDAAGLVPSELRFPIRAMRKRLMEAGKLPPQD